MTDDETPLIGDDHSRSARRTRVGLCLSLIAAVAIVVALATVKRDDGADLGSCPQGRADVALLVSGSVRSFMIPNVYKSLKANLIDFMASRCVNVHPIMYLGLKEAAGWGHGGLPYPHAIPSDLDEALDHVNVAAVDFYAPTDYNLDEHFPWGHCPGEVKYFCATSMWAHFDKAQTLLCMARKVQQEKNIQFSWYMHSRPEYFGTRHRLWTLSRRCWTVGTRTTTRMPSNLRSSLTRTGIGCTTTPFTWCTVRAPMLFGATERVH